MEFVRTNFEVGKASKDIYASRSNSLTHYFDTLSFAKFVKDAILTQTRDPKIRRKLQNRAQPPNSNKTENDKIQQKRKIVRTTKNMPKL